MTIVLPLRARTSASAHLSVKSMNVVQSSYNPSEVDSELRSRIVSMLGSAQSHLGKTSKNAVRPAREAVRLADLHGDDTLIVDTRIALARAYKQSGNFKRASATLFAAREVLQVPTVYRIDYELANLMLSQEQYQEGLALLTRTLAAVEQSSAAQTSEMLNLHVLLHVQLRAVYGNLGQYVQGVEHAYAALSLCSKEGISDNSILQALIACASIFYLFEDADNARRYYLQGLEWSERLQDTGMQCEALGGLARVASALGDSSGALSYQRRAWNIVKNGADVVSRGRVLTLGSIIYRQMKRFDVAWNMAVEAEELLATTSNRYWHGEAMLLLADLNRLEGNIEAAMATYDELLEYAQKHNFIRKQTMLHQWLSMANQAIGRKDVALEHLQKGFLLREETRGMAELRAVAKMEFGEKIAELERKLAISCREIDVLKTRLDERNGSLVETARTLVDKKHKFVVEDSASDTQSSNNSLDREERNLIWNRFEERFHHVHDRFKETLVAQFPKLTPTELKVCYLLRGGLISKEIAEVLSVSPASVDVYRYRIRKKMELIPEVNLVSYLNSI